MSTANDPAVTTQVTRTSQIIVAALVASLVMFLGIVVFLKFQPKGKPDRPVVEVVVVRGLGPITAMSIVFALIGVASAELVPRFVADGQRKQIARGTWRPPNAQGGRDAGPLGDREKLAMVYQTQKIVGAALNEGPAFLALFAYMTEGQPVALVLALVLIVGVGLRFPSRDRVDGWIEGQLERLLQERQSGL